uniref:Uncharacterized protein n=1 Tax=Heterorhabditis bacteriophora TaxID=37862 RepID=A0A1I7WA79_HETBA
MRCYIILNILLFNVEFYHQITKLFLIYQNILVISDQIKPEF